MVIVYEIGLNVKSVFACDLGKINLYVDLLRKEINFDPKMKKDG